MKRRAFILVILGVFLVLLLGAKVSVATEFTFNTTNAALLPYPAPYVGLWVNLTSPTTAVVQFQSEQSLTNGGYNYLLGDTSAAAVNVNAQTFKVTAVNESNSLNHFLTSPNKFLQLPPESSSGSADGFGNFNVTINISDGFSGSATDIQFVLTNMSGTWSSAADVLVANADGYIAAVHTFPCVWGVNCNRNSTPGTTNGYAAVTVPEPGAMLLLAVGLLGYAGIRRRCK